MSHRLQVLADADAVAAAAAVVVGDCCRAAVADHGRFTFAVSGGRTPWAVFARLRETDLPWDRVTLYQVDERVAPAGDADRNLAHLHAAVGGLPVRIVAMPVDLPDLDRAADLYARELPPQFDLVHLGLGADGHTASLVPGDAVLDVTDRRVAVTAHRYQGRRRMTLTFPALATARHTLWLVTGADKQTALAGLIAGDRSFPAGRVEAADSLILADAAAARTTGDCGEGVC